MPRMSYEGLMGTVLALLVVMLDQAGIKNPYVLWTAYFLALLLCLDATIRSSWPKTKKFGGSGIVLLLFILFAAYLLNHLHHSKIEPSAQIQAPTPKPPRNDDSRPPTDTPTIPKSKRIKIPVVNRPTAPVPTQTVINAPNGIGISGGTVTSPQVNNNFERPYRHLTDSQKIDLKALADSLPDDASFLHIEIVNDPETLKYGNEIASFFRPKTKTIGVGLSYPQGMPEGVYVQIESEQAALFPTAQRIATAFNQSGIPCVLTGFAVPHTGQIYILIGVRPEH